MSRELTREEIKEITSLQYEDITSTKLKDLFAVRLGQDKPRFEPGDYFILNTNVFHNTSAVKTTVGRFVANKVMYPDVYLKKYGYNNDVLNVGNIEKVESKINDMLLEDEMTVEEFFQYLNRSEWLGMNMAFYLLPSMNYAMNTPIPEVIELRDQLFEKYKKEIDAGDQNTVSKIEKELVGKAKEYLVKSGNPGYDFFESGEFNFKNNYKKSSILGGAFLHPYTKKVTVSKENYMNGITPHDYPIMSNLTIVGGYARGVSTQKGGYETKKLNSSMQAVSLDEPGTDCGTPYTVRIKLPDAKLASMLYKYRYIVDNGELTLLTEDNIKKYAGQEVNLRSPLFCKGKHICSKCAGELFYKIDIKNAGLLTSTFSGSLMNKSMKSMHDSSINIIKINFDKYIRER